MLLIIRRLLELCLDANDLKSGEVSETVQGGWTPQDRYSDRTSDALTVQLVLFFSPVTLNLCPHVCKTATTSSSLGPRARPGEEGKGEIQNGCHTDKESKTFSLSHQPELCHMATTSYKLAWGSMYFLT